MIFIDLPADLNMEDDEGRNVALLADSSRADLSPGDVVVAGRAGFWSWSVVDDVSDGVVRFHQVSAREAARYGQLVVQLPT